MTDGFAAGAGLSTPLTMPVERWLASVTEVLRSGYVLLGEAGVEIACSFIGGEEKQLVFEDGEAEACGIFALLVFYADRQGRR